MFTIEMLPADYGDCLWIEYGSANQTYRVLIDGGPRSTYRRLKKVIQARMGGLPDNDRRFELLIISHIDEDHLGGILKLLEDEELGVRFGDIWFNGYKHIPTDDKLGPLKA